MSESDNSVDGTERWSFEKDEVLIRVRDGRWWHVRERLEDVDTDERKYYLEDATWTEAKYFGSEWVEEKFESAGWSCRSKPAAKRGCRVNGALTDPGGVDFWRGNECQHDHPCSECGAGCEDVDILVGAGHVLTDCRNCDNWGCEAI